MEDKKRVLIIYTGGTMGMRRNKQGALEPAAGFLTEEIRKAPEMSKEEMPSYTILEYSPLLDSSCMGPSDWSQICKDIEDNYLSYDGFVVIIGTDTMAYAASAVSFLLENLGKTVVFTGSQIPFCEVYNDARHNLIISILFATTEFFPEVCICFADRLLRANRTVKVNSVGLAAFDSPNFPALATFGAFVNYRKDLALPQPRGPFRVHKLLEANVIVIKLVPGFDDESLIILVQHSVKLKGIVLEMYGSGNGPTSSKAGLLSAIEMAREKGIVVVATSQCLQGGVSLDSYSMGISFRSAGVISGGDMTTEACTTKLAYLFSRGATSPAKIAEMLTSDLRGEVSVNSLVKFFASKL